VDLPEELLLSLKEPGRGTVAGQVPLRLLAEAVKQLQGRQAHQACELLLFYMERCWAAAEAARSSGGGGSSGEGGGRAPGGGSGSGSPTAASAGAPAGSSGTAALAGSGSKSQAAAAQLPAVPAARHLVPEHAVWLLELVAAFACLGCIQSKPGKPSPKDVGYLPQASFQMLLSLPIAAAELSLQLKQMQRVDGELMAATWQRLAVVLAATVQQLCQQKLAAPAEEELAGRLAVVCGCLLASLAARAHSGKMPASFKAGVPGALYAALEAVQPCLPAGSSSRVALQEVLAAGNFGALVESLARLATSAGTAIMQVGGLMAGLVQAVVGCVPTWQRGSEAALSAAVSLPAWLPAPITVSALTSSCPSICHPPAAVCLQVSAEGGVEFTGVPRRGPLRELAGSKIAFRAEALAAAAAAAGSGTGAAGPMPPLAALMRYAPGGASGCSGGGNSRKQGKGPRTRSAARQGQQGAVEEEEEGQHGVTTGLFMDAWRVMRRHQLELRQRRERRQAVLELAAHMRSCLPFRQVLVQLWFLGCPATNARPVQRLTVGVSYPLTPSGIWLPCCRRFGCLQWAVSLRIKKRAALAAKQHGLDHYR
jgi:hypothetical protein